MKHILVIPEELINKLNEARAVDDISLKWQQIQIDTPEDMINRIIDDMNRKYNKLNITSYRIEKKDSIKHIIGNKGNSSIYAGYFENENTNIDGLFFYIPPNLDTGNDVLTRQVMPVLLGIYEGLPENKDDCYFHNRPVYIVNVNEKNRIEQDAVKTCIICAELMGFNYMDVFNRPYRDVICGENDVSDSVIIDTIDAYDKLLTQNGKKRNGYFEYDRENRIVKVLSNGLEDSSNITADLYRYCIKIIPAVYLASKEKYALNIKSLKDIRNDKVELVTRFMSKLECTI